IGVVLGLKIRNTLFELLHPVQQPALPLRQWRRRFEVRYRWFARWFLLAVIVCKRANRTSTTQRQSDQREWHKSLPFENTHSSLLGCLARSQRSGDLLVCNPFALVASGPATARPTSHPLDPA